MNVTVEASLRMFLNIPTIVLSIMTERNGCRQMLGPVLSIVTEPKSLSVDPSVTSKFVTFHSGIIYSLNLSIFFKVIKSRKTRWVGHIANMGK
jgi:hypothetical protein